LKVEYVL